MKYSKNQQLSKKNTDQITSRPILVMKNICYNNTKDPIVLLKYINYITVKWRKIRNAI